MAAQRQHRKRQTEERLAAGPHYADSGLVFTMPGGPPIHPLQLVHALQGLLDEGATLCCDIGSFLMDRDPVTGEAQQAPFEFTRLAIPRRVYTQAHLDVIAEALAAVQARADQVRGYEIAWEPAVLRHFTSKLRPVD